MPLLRKLGVIKPEKDRIQKNGERERERKSVSFRFVLKERGVVDS